MLYNIIVPMLTLIVLVVGIFVCASRLNNNKIYKYGLWFFLIRVFIVILDTVINRLIIPNVIRNMVANYRIGWMISLLNVPSLLLSLTAYIILIIGFYKIYDRNMIS